jgi:CRISPR-associated protein Cas1
MPARDDALPLYVKDQGATVGKSGDELTVKSRQATLQKVKLIDTSQVSIFGNVQVTAQALRELVSAGIPLCHFSYGGWFTAVTVGMIHKNVELRIAQFAAAADPGRSLALARQFVLGKIKNCRTLLRRHLEEGQGREVLGQLNTLMRKAEAVSDAASLLGIEGMAAKEYFAGFAKLLNGGETFNVEGRNRRPPRDPVNALLSFVYALLVKEWTLALYATGFDPLLGFYHRPRYGRPSLALDLTEEFRPLVADSTVLTLINNGEVSPGSFIQRAGAVALTDAGRRAVIAAFERRMETEVTHPLFGYRISYRRVLEVQARLLGRVLLGEISEYPNFCTR